MKAKERRSFAARGFYFSRFIFCGGRANVVISGFDSNVNLKLSWARFASKSGLACHTARAENRTFMASPLAILTLLGVAILALFPDAALLPASARLAEKSALLFLAATFFIALVPALQKRIVARRDAATFLLLCAFFVLFQIADRAGPRQGFSLQFAALSGDLFSVSYALRLAVVGALVSFPAWFRDGGPERFIFAALLLIGVLGLGSFWFLARFYKVGVTETLDPTFIPTLFLQVLGFGAIAALCRAATASPKWTRLIFCGMPFVLLLVWAKMQLVPLPAPAEDAE